MSEATPIGSGRYGLLGTLSTTLPRIVRHRGIDTILDRDVTILVLTDASIHRDNVLESASRAVLVEDGRLQRVYDVERSEPSIIVTEPLAGRTFSSLVSRGISATQVRAIIGETAQALDAGARKGLHHLNLSPEAIRVLPGGEVKVSGLGIEAAALDLENRIAGNDPMAADRADARALVEILYYGLTGRWPGKRPGIPSAPRLGGVPVTPSTLVAGIDPILDDLCVRTWSGQPPISAAEVARALGSWEDVKGYTDTRSTASAGSAGTAAGAAAGAASSTGVASAARGVLGRLRRSSSSAPAIASQQAPSTAALERSASAEPAQLEAGPEEDLKLIESAESINAEANALAEPALIEADQDELLEAAPQYVEVTGPVNPIPSVLTNVSETAPATAPVPAEPFTGSFEVNFDDFDEEDEEITRSVSRTTTGVVIGLVVVVLVGMVFAITNLLQLAGISFTDPDKAAADTVPTATQQQQGGGGGEQAPEPAPIKVTGAKSLSDQHPELEDRLVDGDTSQEWFTQWHKDPAGLGPVSLAVTLEQAAPVSGIDIHGTGQGGNVQIRATSADDPQGGTILAEGPFTQGSTTFSFDATETDTIVLVITELPRSSDGDNKATITEITLR